MTAEKPKNNRDEALEEVLEAIKNESEELGKEIHEALMEFRAEYDKDAERLAAIKLDLKTDMDEEVGWNTKNIIDFLLKEEQAYLKNMPKEDLPVDMDTKIQDTAFDAMIGKKVMIQYTKNAEKWRGLHDFLPERVQKVILLQNGVLKPAGKHPNNDKFYFLDEKGKLPKTPTRETYAATYLGDSFIIPSDWEEWSEVNKEESKTKKESLFANLGGEREMKEKERGVKSKFETIEYGKEETQERIEMKAEIRRMIAIGALEYKYPSKLDPQLEVIQTGALRIIEKVGNIILENPKFKGLRIIEMYRSKDRQTEYRKKGWTDAYNSVHEMGGAIDFAYKSKSPRQNKILDELRDVMKKELPNYFFLNHGSNYHLHADNQNTYGQRFDTDAELFGAIEQIKQENQNLA